MEVLIPKKKDKNPDEYYRGKIRSLEKENRTLRKRLKQLETSRHIYEDLLLEPEEDVEEILKPTKKEYCPDCKEGTVIVIMEFEDKTIHGCTHCHWKRSKRK